MKIKYTVRIKPEHNPPDLGGGPGVIATQEVRDKTIDAKDYQENPHKHFAHRAGIVQHGQELLNEWVEVVFEIIDEK